MPLPYATMLSLIKCMQYPDLHRKMYALVRYVGGEDHGLLSVVPYDWLVLPKEEGDVTLLQWREGDPSSWEVHVVDVVFKGMSGLKIDIQPI